MVKIHDSKRVLDDFQMLISSYKLTTILECQGTRLIAVVKRIKLFLETD